MKMKNVNLFVIVNQGVHSIEKKIEKQFVEVKDKEFLTLSFGNVPMSFDTAKILSNTLLNGIRDINSNEKMLKSVRIIWSGLNIYNLITFQVIKNYLDINTIVLIYNNVTKQYDEWDIEPRKLLFD